ncbi:hypothetical protein A9Q91_03215 [Candidatus Gracilibacteria bacterium 28_42_T64]|nr:hypothetical protein A9Q91_03215 [Candidatus Gracilibacteria bacterium 28_42_T64]
MFKKKSLQKRKLKTTYTKKKTPAKKKKTAGSILKFITYTVIFFVTISFILGLVLYKKYIVNLPSISELENLEIAESSTIYDKNGIELYKIFKEKRTYIPFDEINSNMINALVAGEDKRYWDNPGFDVIGLIRAVINKVIGKNVKVEGTSTITQQLIRNTIIKNEKTIERKIKEIYLAYKLTNGVSKEKIIELYLNKISFGSNAFGIEQASQTFFAKKAKELNIYESSILASLPKGPTFYSPYNHPDRIVGYPYIFTEDDTDNIIQILSSKDALIHQEMLQNFISFINNIKATKLSGTDKILLCGLNNEYFKNNLLIDNDGCSVMAHSKLLNFLNAIQIKVDSNFIEYQTGRKDFILGRMLEDEYIDFSQYKEAIIEGIGYKFNIYSENIKAPHFVFYVKEYLENLYGKDVVSMGGLKIFTTLDYELQEKAEEIVKKHAELNEKRYDASSAALVSLDNKTGDIITMVGGKDYFDADNKGNVNIITSKLQPGSTFKPFVYSIGMYKEEIGSKTPIYDVETQFPGYKPSNFDGKFMGKMNLSTALNNSRNIPAIKMFYMAGGERSIVSFMKTLGVDSLKNHGNYGAPLALGTGEMTPLELASAYSVFANMGIKKEINPILKIVDSKGNIVTERKEAQGEEVISSSQSYIMNNMLSDTSTRPEFWNNYLSLRGRKVAAKTGTSTKQYTKYGRKTISPRNLWTIGYTPQYTTVVWAGNPDGTELNFKGNGLEGAGVIWKEFMELAHKGKKVENWRRPAGVKEISISEISGLLPSLENSSSSFTTKSLFLNTPTEYDNSFRSIQVDALCNGLVTDATPVAALKNVTLAQFHSLSPSNASWENPVQDWVNSDKARELYGNIPNLITSISDQTCKREERESSIIIKSTTNNGDGFVAGENFIELAYKSNHPIIKIDILIGGSLVDEIKLRNKKTGTYSGKFHIPSSFVDKKTTLTIRAVDNQFYSNTEEKNIVILKKDIEAPNIKITNPSDLKIKLYNDSFFNLRGKVTDKTSIRTINIYIDGVVEKIGITDRNFVYPITGSKLSIGTHIIKIDAIDNYFNKGTKEIQLEVLEK